jgi:hypothetical protein
MTFRPKTIYTKYFLTKVDRKIAQCDTLCDTSKIMRTAYLHIIQTVIQLKLKNEISKLNFKGTNQFVLGSL